MTFTFLMKFTSQLLIGLAAMFWMGSSCALASWDRNEWMLQLDQAIEDPSERERIKAALDVYFTSFTPNAPVDQREAVKALYMLDSSFAKPVAIFATGWSLDVLERDVEPFTPTIEDLPFLLKCFIAHGISLGDMFRTNAHLSFVKVEELEKIAAKVNAVLKTHGRIDPASPSGEMERLEAYYPQNLRHWAHQQLRTALSKDHSSKEEVKVLRALDDQLINDILKGEVRKRTNWLRWALLSAVGVAFLWLLIWIFRSRTKTSSLATL